MSPSPDEHPVRVARKAKGWRLEDLGQRAGCSKPLLSNIEHSFIPRHATRQKIADALEMRVQDLWPEEYAT